MSHQNLTDAEFSRLDSQIKAIQMLDPPDVIISNFSTPLKTNFEDYNLWLRFGLALSLSGDHRDAIQSFNECLRIDQSDPLPAMLAAKISLLNLNDPENGLKLAHIAIDRCRNNDQYKKMAPILSKCYLLVSVINAHIYEREPESIKQFKRANLEVSLEYIDLAKAENPSDYLVYFHAALHDARQQSYKSAIDNIRHAIKLNPHHLPSVQLLLLSLSALKLYDDALVLCESALREFEDNLTLLYIKCNLEQNSGDSKGYKLALSTTKEMLRCIKRASHLSMTRSAKEELSTQSQQQQAQQQQQQQQNQQQLQSSQPNQPPTQNHASNGPTSAATNGTGIETSKQTIDLFAEQRNSSRAKACGPLAGEAAIWFLVAEIYIKMGSIKDAELCANEGSNLEDVALSFQMMFTRGLIAKAKNNLMEAKSFFQSCLALNPRHAMALQQIAHVHYLLGNYPTAEKFLKDSLDLDSSCPRSWYYLSLVFIETNQHDKASCEEFCREAIKMTTDGWSTRFFLKYLDFILKVSSLKITTSTDVREKRFRVNLEDSDSEVPVLLKRLPLAKFLWSTRFSRWTTIALLIYMIVKYNLLAVYRFRYNLVLKTFLLKDEYKNSSQELICTNSRYFNFPSVHNDSLLNREIVYLREKLNHLGDPFVHVYGRNLSTFCFLPLLFTLWFILLIHIKFFGRVYSEALAVLISPVEVEQDIRQHISKTSRDMLESLVNKVKIYELYTIHGTINGSSEKSIDQSVPSNRFNRIIKLVRLELKFKSIFGRIEKDDLVEPAVLSQTWTDKLMRHSMRIEAIIVCLQLRKMVERIWLIPARDNRFCKEMDNYESDGWKNRLSRLELSLGVIWLSCISCVISLAILISFMYRTRWINHLIRQQESCLKRLTNCKEVDERTLTNVFVTLINFGVYVRSYRNYKTMTDFVLSIICFGVIFHAIINNLIVSSFGSISPREFYLEAISGLITDNIQLCLCLMILRRTHKFVNRLVRLLTLMAEKGEEFVPMSIQLHSFLMKKRYLDNQFGNSILGFTLDAESLQTYNRYKVGLMLFYYRNLTIS